MKVFRYIWAILFVLPFNVSPQALDLVWPLGEDVNPMANLNFTSGTMVVDTDTHIMTFRSSNASISDSIGHLLMYVNGCLIANALDDTMMNGDGLNPDPCTSANCGGGNTIVQGNLILPDPGSNKYYLFHETCNYSNGLRPIKLYTSIIDLSLDSGRGEVLNKNTVIYQHILCDGILSAVKHANGIDWWILLHNRLSDEFVTFLLTAGGIQGPFIQSIGPVFNDDSKGNSKFSPDGSRFVTTTNGSNMNIFDFDRCTGILSNHQFIANPVPSIGISFIEFSSSSRFLYFILSQYIYQYDMNAANIANSALIVANYDGFVNFLPTYFSVGQLAQDKKIYISSGGTMYFHVIDSPDSLGIASNVFQHSIQLPCKNYTAIPSLPNFHLGALNPHACDSINSIESIFNKVDIEIYPNPSASQLKIKLINKIENKCILRVYNSLGQKLIIQKINFKNEVEEIILDLSDYPTGLYYLAVENDVSIVRKSFVKL